MNIFHFKKWSIIVCPVLLLVSVVHTGLVAQTQISLSQAISSAQENNRAIHIAEQTTTINEANLARTRANFLPYVGLQVTDVVSNNPLNVFGFKLLQEEVQQADFNPALLNDPGSMNQFAIQLNAMMPLNNPEARAKQRAAQSQVQMQKAMGTRTVQGVELQVTQAYYTLVLTQAALEVLEKTYAAALDNYQVAKNFYDRGLLLKSELLEMEIMVNQSQLALGAGKTNWENAQSQFNQVINTMEFTEYLPTDSLVVHRRLIAADSGPDPDRADFKAMQHSIYSMEHMLRAADKAFIPKLQAFGNYQLNDEVPFENRATNYQLGLTMVWDIYKGSSRRFTKNKIQADIQKQRMVLEQKRSEAELQSNLTKRSIEDLKNQIALHDLSIRQAKEVLEIKKNRFAQGLERSTDIVNAETDLSHNRLARLEALFELNIKNAYLDFILK